MAELSWTINPDGGGDYVSLATWDAAQAQDLTDDGGDFVTVTLETGGSADTGGIVVLDTDWVTAEGNDITITASGAHRHTGARGTGYRLATNDGYDSAIYIKVGHVIINGLAATNSHLNRRGAFQVAASNVWLLNCLGYDCGKQGSGIFYDDSATNHSLYCINCIALNSDKSGFFGQGGSDTGTGLYCCNCISLNADTYGFEKATWKNFFLRNCYAGASGTQDYGPEGGAGSFSEAYYCTAGDSSFATVSYTVQSNCRDGQTASTGSPTYFTNVIPTIENINLTSASSDLYANAGYDYDGLSWYHEDCESSGQGMDYADTVRTTWCRGAHEYVAPAAGLARAKVNRSVANDSQLLGALVS